MLDWAYGLLFGTGYGLLISGIALLAAVPYGAWQGLRWLGRQITGRRHGDA